MDYFHSLDNLIAPRLTYRAEGAYENCDFSDTHTLQYYQEEGILAEDNPFSEILIKGNKGEHWKWTAGGQLKLLHNYALSWSGAAKLRVKEGYVVKLQITVANEDYMIGKRNPGGGDPKVKLKDSYDTGLIRKRKNDGSGVWEVMSLPRWPIWDYNDSPTYGKEQVQVVLTGDCGDYLSIDIENQWDGIYGFRLKLCDEIYEVAGAGHEINTNVWIKCVEVCKIDETSASGGNIKIEDYEGYPIWRDERETPYKIVVKDAFAGLVTVFTQDYSARNEASGAISSAKVWIDNTIRDNGGGGNGGGGNGGGDDDGGGDGGDGGNGGDDGGNGGTNTCPDNASLNASGQCQCDAGYKLDSATMTCVEKEGSMSNYILLGGLALLGLALLG